MERLVGKKAPQFELNAVKGDGSDFKKVSLNDILSLQYVIPNKLQSIIEIIGTK